MFPASLAHTLTGNTFGNIEGGFLSNNTTHICIHTGEGTCIHTVQEGQVPGMSISSGIPIAHKHDLRFLRYPPYGSDLVIRDGYRIHVAQYRGKVVAVKVYQGANSAQRLEADLEINSSLFHPTILQTVAVCRATQTPFLVFSMESDSLSPIPISLGGFKSLVYYLADALSRSEQDSLVVGAQLIRDISSGLDYLASIEQTLAVSRLMFDLLVDESNNICITVGLGEGAATGTQEDGHLDVFHNLCSKSFLEANNECHLDKSQAPTADNSASGSSSHPDLPFSSPDGEPIAETDSQSDSPLTPPRREYAFVPDRGHQSLREISTSYARFMRSIIAKRIRHLRRKGQRKSTIVAHRCPGYRRDEVTLSTSVLRTAIIQHLTPSPREICPICQQLVEDGTFNCFCGQGDDGISSTIECSQCGLWSHRTCQVNGHSVDHLPFTCASCSRPPSPPPPPSASASLRLPRSSSFNFPTPPVHHISPRVSRPELAGYAHRHSKSIEYRSWNVGEEDRPSWVSAVFLNGIEYGRGQSNTTKASSMERAASQAMAVIERPRYHH